MPLDLGKRVTWEKSVSRNRKIKIGSERTLVSCPLKGVVSNEEVKNMRHDTVLDCSFNEFHFWKVR